MSQAKRPPLRGLSIFLLKTEYKDPKRALRSQSNVTLYKLQASSKVRGVLALKSPSARQPPWVDFVAPHLDASAPVQQLRNASTSAALFVKTGGRLFVLSFGHGRHLIRPDSYVHDFGLRVVLNAVEPSRLKSVDARTIDELTLHTQLDVSRESTFETFGLDVTRDLVRSVTGQPRDESLAHRATGADVLAVSSRTRFEELPALCRRLLAEYEAETYKANFDWVDQLRFERDPAVIARLEERLVEDIASREITDLHLAPPDNLDWRRLPRFTFSTRDDDELDADPRITGYLESVSDDDAITVARLKRDKVEAFDSDEEFMGQWSVHDCIVYETRLDDRLFVLSAGDWYRVDISFAKSVASFVDALPMLDVSLPEAHDGEPEGDYNERAATEAEVLCMDKQLIRKPFPTGIELCDLLTKDKKLIHVKKRGSSSTLSHLFSQGLVSGQLLVGEGEFRAEATAVVSTLDSSFTGSIPADPPQRGECEVGFVVVSRSKKHGASALPFFSQVNLRSQAKVLQGLGFTVSFLEVRER